MNTIRFKKGYTIASFFRKHYVRVFGSGLASLSAFLAFLFVLVDDWRTKLPTATTIIIMAVVLIDREQPSGGIQNGILRLAGTTLGVAIAFCIVIFFDDTPEDGLDKDVIFIYTAIFTLISRFVMQNPQYLFFAYTFFVTNIFLFYFQSIDFATFVGLIGLRAVAIGIGIAIATVIMSLWPVRAPIRLRRSISNGISLSKKMVNQCLTIEGRSVSASNIELLQNKINQTYKKLTKIIFEQEMLSEAAKYEPDIISPSFSTIDFYKIYHSEILLITDSVIMTQLLLMMHKHNSRSNNITFENIIHPGIQEKLMDCLKLLENRCLTPFFGIYESQIKIFDLKTSFINYLLEYDELIQKASVEVIGFCASHFSLFNLILSLERMNTAITSLEANKIATRPPGIPFRIPVEKIVKRFGNHSDF